MFSVEPAWLDANEVVQTNAEIVEATSEPFSVINMAGLESALGRARSAYVYGDVRDPAELACLYLFGIAQAHPFLQGNKRTAFYAAVMFLEANGYTLADEADEVLGPMITDALTDAGERERFPGRLRAFVEVLRESR